MQLSQFVLTSFWKSIYSLLIYVSYVMKILQPNILKDWVSTQEHIEILSNPKNQISIVEMVNLIVKFSVDYILEWVKTSSTWVESMPSEDILWEAVWSLIFQYRWLISTILHEDIVVNKDIDTFVLKVSYQLKMLLDLPKTLALVFEIIWKKIPYNSRGYNGLDLWTGSWILLLAQYIQAKRNWFADEEIQNIWIELEHNPAEIWNQLAQKFRFGKIIQWDTTKQKTIQELWLPFLSFVSNENLPYEKNQLSKEPFIENLSSLIRAWYQLSDIEGFFPQVFYYTNFPPYTISNKRPKKIDVKQVPSFHWFLDTYESDSKYIKVPSIQMWQIQKNLSEIGRDFEPFFSREFLSSIWKRW